MGVMGATQNDDRRSASDAASIGQGTDYGTFVETRIDGLASQARRDLRGHEPAAVRREWAVPELATLGVLVLALVVSLVL